VADDTDTPLPHAVALAWGVAERPQRGPKRELSIERIVETAIEIADADGLGAVSMSKVASSLGYTTMSLYRHVTSKDDLLLLMQDEVTGFETPPLTDGDWREQLRAWTLANLEAMRAHPWFSEIPVTGVPMTPNTLRIVDAGLGALRTTTLSDQEKMATILLLTSYARAVGSIERDIVAADGPDGDGSAASGAPYAQALAELVTAERFPYLRPVIVSGAYTDEDFDDFAFGLERLLDGVQHYLTNGSPVSPEDDADAAAAKRDAALYASDKKLREAAKARREAEKRLREAAKRERELLGAARERSAKR